MQVFSLWQACVCICYFYPQSPDVLAIVNAAANEAGDFSIHASISIDTASPDTGALHAHLATKRQALAVLASMILFLGNLQ